MNNIHKLIGVMIVGSFVAGCAGKPALPISDFQQVKPTDGSGGIDIYQKRREQGEVAPALAGDQQISVRTYAKNPKTSGLGMEIPGATCHVKGAGFEGTVTTPGMVRVPLYRKRTGSMSAECHKEGYATGYASAQPYDKTARDRHQNTQGIASGGGLIGAIAGVLIVSAINAASDDEKHDWKYPNLAITLRPDPAASAAAAIAATPVSVKAAKPAY